VCLWCSCPWQQGQRGGKVSGKMNILNKTCEVGLKNLNYLNKVNYVNNHDFCQVSVRDGCCDYLP
jgi:hypothetical protein